MQREPTMRELMDSAAVAAESAGKSGAMYRIYADRYERLDEKLSEARTIMGEIVFAFEGCAVQDPGAVEALQRALLTAREHLQACGRPVPRGAASV